VRKKVDALGKFDAKTVGIDPGLLEKLLREAITPEEMDMTRKDWTNKKMKYRVIKLNSRPVYLGIPSNFARSLRKMGRSIMRTASRTGGRIPCKIPLTAGGSVQTQASQLNFWHISLRLLREPINATGNVQRRIRAAVME
jgi:hypothetical protein